MNLKLPHFSTIIIVNKNQQQTKALRIKTKHLNRLKHYAFSAAAVFAALCITVIYLYSREQKDQQEKQALLQQIATLKNAAPAVAVAVPAANSGNAKSYIQEIQGKLQKINDYLSKRGLKEFSIKTIIGDDKPGAIKLNDSQQYSLYNDYLTHLLNAVAYTPMGYPRISNMTSFFGLRSDPFNTGSAENHPGVDFQGQKGDPVKCTANGEVDFAGWKGGYGNCVIVKHQNNFETLYGHLSHISVKIGTKVAVGDVVGQVGSTGHSTGTHLHYEVRVNGRPVNPVKFLSLNR